MKPIVYVNCTYHADELRSFGSQRLLAMLIDCWRAIGSRAVCEELFE